jgi:hypothetical protein
LKTGGFLKTQSVKFEPDELFVMSSGNNVANDNRKNALNRYGALGLILFSLGSGLSAYLFFLIQILNSYPFWDYINGYRLQLKPFTAVYGDITYLPAPLQLLKYTQLFDIAVALAFIGLFIWKLAGSPKVNRKTVLSAFGYTLLVTGTICAVIVYLQIDVLTSTHLPWGWYAWATERVAYNTQFLGAEYNCTFLNYAQLLYISISMAIVGFILWNHYSSTKFKAPSTLVVASIFIVSVAFLISGLLLLFPSVTFTSPDPSMPATPYAVQGTLLLWMGAAFLMVSIVGLFEKLKQALEYARTHFSRRLSQSSNQNASAQQNPC